MKRRTRMFDSRDARVHCSLSKYTLLIDQGRVRSREDQDTTYVNRMSQR